MRLSLRRSFIFGFFSAIVFTIFGFILFNNNKDDSHEESHSYGATNEIIYPFAYETIITPKIPLCFNKDSYKDIIIIVHTQPNHILQRSVYRNTMGKEWIKKHFGVDIIFVLGKHEDEKFQKIVEQEAASFEDILQADFLDTYWNLTIKAIVWMKFISENCAEKNPFIVKTDDDVVIEMKRMKDIFLQYSNQLQNKFYCKYNTRMLVERSNKSRWYVPETEIDQSYKFYDPYCSGLAYVTSTAVIIKEWEYLINHKIHYCRIDDFFVTGKLAAEADVGHINGPGVFNLGKNTEQALKSNGTFFLIHNRYLGPILWKQMLKIWTKNLALTPIE